MYTDVDKTQQDITHSQKTQKQVATDTLHLQDSQNTSLPFVDKRPQALEFRRFQEMADNSPKVKEATQLKAMLDQRFVEKYLFYKNQKIMKACPLSSNQV